MSNQIEHGVQLLHSHNWSEARRLYEGLLGSGPPDPAIHYGLGVAAFNLDDVDTADLNFRAALRLKSDDANAYYFLGRISEIRGNKKGAYALYDGALAINPAHRSALERKNRIDALKPPTPAVPVESPVPTPAAPSPAVVKSDAAGMYDLLKSDTSPSSRRAVDLIDALRMRVTPRKTALRGMRRSRLLIALASLIGAPLLAVAVAQLFFNEPTYGVTPTGMVVAFATASIAWMTPWIRLALYSRYLSNLSYVIEDGRLTVVSGILSRRVAVYELFRVTHLEIAQNFWQKRTHDGVLVLTFDGGKSVQVVGLAPIEELESFLNMVRDLVQTLRSSNLIKGIVR